MNCSAELDRRDSFCLRCGRLVSTGDGRELPLRVPSQVGLASLVLPGAGQYLNGQRGKAAIFCSLYLAMLGSLLVVPWPLALFLAVSVASLAAAEAYGKSAQRLVRPPVYFFGASTPLASDGDRERPSPQGPDEGRRYLQSSGGRSERV